MIILIHTDHRLNPLPQSIASQEELALAWGKLLLLQVSLLYQYEDEMNVVIFTGLLLAIK